MIHAMILCTVINFILLNSYTAWIGKSAVAIDLEERYSYRIARERETWLE